MNKYIKPMEDKYLESSLNMIRRTFTNSENAEEAAIVVNLVQEIRSLPLYIPDLEFVMTDDNDEVIGYVMFSKVRLSGKLEEELLVLNPVAVKTELQRQHISKELIEYGFEKAKEKGFKAVIVEGNPLNYRSRGFVTSKDFGIVAGETVGLPALECLMVKELEENALRNISGVYEYTDYKTLMNQQGDTDMNSFNYITLREKPEIMDNAASWFNSKWGVPKEAYLECMNAYLNGETEYGWYLCLDGEKIVGGMGVIENDFHDRKDLTPNVCAVYTDEDYRKKGIAGTLLNMVVDDLKSKGISPVYLVTDHTGFYERYGWEFYCMAQGDGEPEMTRLYIHR